MKPINITEDGIIEFYGNKVGFLDNGTANIDIMFDRPELTEYLSTECLYKIERREGLFDRLANEKNNTIEPIKLCRIYRLNAEADVRMKFVGLSELEKQGFSKPDPKNYSVVFDGNIGTDNLEKIYSLMQDRERGFAEGTMLFISDVVELYDDSSSTFYYVDKYDFKEIAFTDNETQKSVVKTNVEKNIESNKESIQYDESNGEEKTYTFTWRRCYEDEHDCESGKTYESGQAKGLCNDMF